jgi:hypothetical protein
MRILFIDPSRWQYTVDAPYERPLGGSQSALCYLAAELAQLGHAITLINGVAAESESRGVRQRNLEALGTPAPVLFYTSTPFRGLDVLLNCFPRIRQSVPDVRLRIFSSM